LFVTYNDEAAILAARLSGVLATVPSGLQFAQGSNRVGMMGLNNN
jgi:hypothetical protein